MTVDELIFWGRENKCSDLHLSMGNNPIFRMAGQLKQSDFVTSREEVKELIYSIMSKKHIEDVENGIDADFSYETPDGCRQRVNVYQEQGNLCAAIRLLNDYIPDMEDLGLPPILKKLAMHPRGLILVTGPTGSGKSTTLATMVDYINKNKATHILTIEDPIEYKYPKGKAMIHQREVGRDVKDFASALRSALREDPDVILVGEMRDYETISAAVTAAETGHLVLSTLHTTGAANTIDRIVDVFPPHSQGQIRSQLSNILRGVITQTLLPDITGQGRVPALEIMLGCPAVGNLIRDGKTHQLSSAMQMGMKDGMQPLNAALARLVSTHKITFETAASITNDMDELNQYMNKVTPDMM